MEDIGVNVTDVAVIGIVLLSALLAFLRGLVRETFSVVGWVGALVIAWIGFPYVRPYGIWRYLYEMFESDFLADLAVGVAIFLVAKIALTFLSSAISRQIRESELNALDRTLGFVFGLARGSLIVCLAYLALAWAWPPQEQPNWIRDARVLPLVEYGAQQLVNLLPDDTRGRLNAEGIETPNLGTDETVDKKVVLERLMNPPPAPMPSSAPGYAGDERKALDQLIESVQ